MMKFPLPILFLKSAVRRGAAGFSLIELLSVMMLLSVLAVAAVPAMKGTLDGINISGAAGVAQAEFALARQTAMSRNLPVELRIYQHDDGSGLAWRAMSMVIPASMSGQATDEWVTRGKVLPGGVAFDDTQEYSTMISQAQPTAGEPIAPWKTTEVSTAPALVRNKSYVGFLFNPDGSTNLPNGQPWCLTLKNPRSQSASGKPAANFVAIVVDSLTGRTMVYQP